MTSGLVDFGGGRRLDFTVSTQVAPYQRSSLSAPRAASRFRFP